MEFIVCVMLDWQACLRRAKRMRYAGLGGLRLDQMELNHMGMLHSTLIWEEQALAFLPLYHSCSVFSDVSQRAMPAHLRVLNLLVRISKIPISNFS